MSQKSTSEVKKARVKYTPVPCEVCATEVDPHGGVQDQDFPGKLFCSLDCAEDYELAIWALVKKQRPRIDT